MLTKHSIALLSLTLLSPALATAGPSPDTWPPDTYPDNIPNPMTQLFWQAEQDGTHKWVFYDGLVGQGSYACNGVANLTPFESPDAEDEPPQAFNGTMETTFLGNTCHFHGNGTIGPTGENGSLECDGMKALICLEDDRLLDICVEGDLNFNDTMRMKAVSHCDIV